MTKKTVLIFILILIFAGCEEQSLKRYTYSNLAISRNYSIPVNFVVYACKEPSWEKILEKIKEDSLVYDYRYKESKINELNTRGTAELDEKTYALLQSAVRIADESEGAFDPAILPLTILWSFEKNFIIPPEEAIQKALQWVDYRQITWGENRKVTIPPGSGIDLGGIAKGAIVDNIGAYFKDMGIKDFLIEAGGDILISGKKPDNHPWTVAIRHPRKEGNVGIATYPGGPDLAIVTSGDYERFAFFEERRYHHLVDPATGYPTEDNASVTVTASRCADADAYATAAFVMGYDKGLAFLEELPGVEGLIIREKNNTLEENTTSGFLLDRDKLKL